MSSVADVRDGADGDAVAPALLELAGLLLRAPSGVGFVYEVLEIVAARFGVHDAVLVTEDTAIGRQVFRLGRRPLGSGGSGSSGSSGGEDQAAWSLLGAPPGLHTSPAGAVDRAVAAFVTSMASAALKMDVLGHDAGHDPLTGLLNRRSYEQQLAEAVARSRRYGWPFALVLIDLDDFKAVNDELGHAAGDAALRAIGAEIRAVLRRGDVAARLGGDEFALIILNADSPGALEPLLERLRPKLAEVMAGRGVRFSAGLACFPSDADDAVALQKLADERLYADKAAG
ncbi:MAG: GGDEF domain-containing protein [Acidimicrobiales bacterium]